MLLLPVERPALVNGVGTEGILGVFDCVSLGPLHIYILGYSIPHESGHMLWERKDVALCLVLALNKFYWPPHF